MVLFERVFTLHSILFPILILIFNLTTLFNITEEFAQLFLIFIYFLLKIICRRQDHYSDLLENNRFEFFSTPFCQSGFLQYIFN